MANKAVSEKKQNMATPADTGQTQIQTNSVELTTNSVQSGVWSFLRNANFQTLMAVVAVAGTLFNLYLGSKLAPVAQDIATVAEEVDAQAKRQDAADTVTSLYLPRYLATEQQVASLKESISRIEASQVRQEAKLDSVILKFTQ